MPWAYKTYVVCARSILLQAVPPPYEQIDPMLFPYLEYLFGNCGGLYVRTRGNTGTSGHVITHDNAYATCVSRVVLELLFGIAAEAKVHEPILVA